MTTRDKVELIIRRFHSDAAYPHPCQDDVDQAVDKVLDAIKQAVECDAVVAQGAMATQAHCPDVFSAMLDAIKAGA